MNVEAPTSHCSRPFLLSHPVNGHPVSLMHKATPRLPYLDWVPLDLPASVTTPAYVNRPSKALWTQVVHKHILPLTRHRGCAAPTATPSHCNAEPTAGRVGKPACRSFQFGNLFVYYMIEHREIYWLAFVRSQRMVERHPTHDPSGPGLGV